ESSYLLDSVRNLTGEYTSSRWGNTGDGPSAGRYAGILYLFNDPAAGCTSVSGSASGRCEAGKPAPLQYAFRSTDCGTWGHPGCSNFVNMRMDHAVSKSDWTENATHILLQSGFNNYLVDHMGGGQAGAFDI